MRYLIVALQFLTILPVGKGISPGKKDFSGAMALFPAAGLVIGLVLYAADAALSGVFPLGTVSILLVVLLAFLTGGVHLDGLADTVDGLSCGKDREKTLEVMRDSHIGTMGVLSLISVFSLKAAFLGLVPAPLRPVVLIAMPVVSRWSMLLPLRFFPYAREEGKAKIFFESVNTGAVMTATGITLAVAVGLMKLHGFYLCFAAGAGAVLVSAFVGRKIGGSTGDVLGAVNEINEVLFLMVFVLLAR